MFICFQQWCVAKKQLSKELFDKAQAEGKVVIVSSWIKYCTSCASQMKVLDKAKNDFDNINILRSMFQIKK